VAPSKRNQVLLYLSQAPPPLITEALVGDLEARFAPISRQTLRKALFESGLPWEPLAERVRQDSFDHLERTLLALERTYTAGDAARRREVRKIVIEAKTHAAWAARRKPVKGEMVLWLRTWLENPPVFPAWVGLRRNVEPIAARLSPRE
jgi:hypothetical protein